jgi:hypothetical protein
MAKGNSRIDLRSSARLRHGYGGYDEISGKEIPMLHLREMLPDN